MLVKELISPLEFRTKIETQKKVNASLQLEEISRLFSYIDYFNTLTEHETRIMDVNIDEIEVIDELKDFIMPTSVRYDASDLRTKDILIRPNRDDITFIVSEAKTKKEKSIIKDENGKDKEVITEVEVSAVFIKPSIVDFNNLQANLRRLFKKDFKEGKSKLSDLKKEVSFEEVRSKANFGKSVAFYDSPYVPIPLATNLKGILFEDTYFNSTVSELMKYYLKDYLF